MPNKYRIWFTNINEDGVGGLRYHYTSDFLSAVLALRVYVDELGLVKERAPNMFGLSKWDEYSEEWLEWGWESNQDIREYIYAVKS